MRLKKLRLSGFKSFVDPITIPVSGNLTGIVGPNGCGKSNIIDAIRWVMGETRASHLRGDSMADVIFSGSSARKPVGKASVELVFDNADGSAPGQYASYAEIAVRRETGRDGLSDYFINKTKCRRKDIVDIFLGTGLGPHSYSIIEQNAITRIIESKPEELRAMFEEAAGVSRFRERRRETETRIRHTRENLTRVEDIRRELETQLNRLQRQARAAERYKELKAEEQRLHAELIVLRIRVLEAGAAEHEAIVRSRETAMEGLIAALREIEAKIEKARVERTEQTDAFNAVQAEFYGAGAEIQRLEQAIAHARETRAALEQERDRTARAREEAAGHRAADEARRNELEQALLGSEPELARRREQTGAAQTALTESESAMQAWNAEWTAFTQAAAEPDKAREVEGARVAALEAQARGLEEREARLRAEAEALESGAAAFDLDAMRTKVRELDLTFEEFAGTLDALETSARERMDARNRQVQAVEALRGEMHKIEARLAGLRELQAAALGEKETGVTEWLASHNLSKAPRIAKLLNVEEGWERAAERVLGRHLAAVSVGRLDEIAPSLESLDSAELTAIETDAAVPTNGANGAPRLADKVRGPIGLESLLSGVYVAESSAEALAMRGGLASHESVVTRGGVLFGPNWASVSDAKRSEKGALVRAREIEKLEAEIASSRAWLDSAVASLGTLEAAVKATETERAATRARHATTGDARAQTHAQLAREEAQHAQCVNRLTQIAREREEIGAQLQTGGVELAAARERLATAHADMGTLESRGNDLRRRRAERDAALETARTQLREAGEFLHQLEVERRGQQMAFESLESGMTRVAAQLAELDGRAAEIEKRLTDEEAPGAELATRLKTALEARISVETRLTAARDALAAVEASVSGFETARGEKESEIEAAREMLEGERRAREALLVRRETLMEQLREYGQTLEEIAAALAPEAEEGAWQARLEEIGGKISRLGAINLAAIDEYREESDRKQYLDKQYADLSEALATLEDAIQKMDRETRTRLKETFDKANTAFQALFPRLFGGGNAYLELEGEEILECGVRVMARPPGKRNSTIHLLSGGEKALTAVALLFALFELNPAPFCLLDEVDAPLDDANVVRYSDMLKALSQKTQLVYITHNKISMEIAEQLIGVTMSEPGVSRLVSVDVEQALEMVAQ